MPVPTEEITGTRLAHERLHTALDALTAEQLAAPSRLPDWTVGHVLAHLVGHGESIIRRLHGAAEGQQVDQYVGGREGRNAFIAEFSGAPLDELTARLRHVDDTVDELFGGLDPDLWDATVLAGDGGPLLAEALPFSRWREVEVHLVDLGLGHTPADWPEPLVERWLPSLISELRGRVQPDVLMAWLLGRGPAPELSPWG